MSRRDDPEDLALPDVPSPQDLDAKILRYAEQHAPRRQSASVPAWMSGLAAAGIVGIAVLIALPQQPETTFETQRQAEISGDRDHSQADVVDQASAQAAPVAKPRPRPAPSLAASPQMRTLPESDEAQSAGESPPPTYQLEELVITANKVEAVTEPGGDAASSDALDGVTREEKVVSAKRRADSTALTQAITLPDKELEDEAPEHRAKESQQARLIAGSAVSLANDAPLAASQPAPTVSDMTEQRNTTAAPFSLETLQEALQQCADLLTKKQPEEAQRCFQTLSDGCIDCALPETLAEALELTPQALQSLLNSSNNQSSSNSDQAGELPRNAD